MFNVINPELRVAIPDQLPIPVYTRGKQGYIISSQSFQANAHKPANYTAIDRINRKQKQIE